MKYFLCVFNTIYFGIPSECTERVISVSRKQSSVYETENQDAFISLVHLFGCAELTVPHGIVLKSKNRVVRKPPVSEQIPLNNAFSQAESRENAGLERQPTGLPNKSNEKRKAILLVPPLDIDIEIPEEDIFTVPKIFSGNLCYFKGACFIKKDKEERLIFTLDIEKLLEDFN